MKWRNSNRNIEETTVSPKSDWVMWFLVKWHNYSLFFLNEAGDAVTLNEARYRTTIRHYLWRSTIRSYGYIEHVVLVKQVHLQYIE